MIRLENKSGSHNKFYEIRLNGMTLEVRYGRIESGSPDWKVKSQWLTMREAQKAHDKLVLEKERKGYTLAGSEVYQERAERLADYLLFNPLLLQPYLKDPEKFIEDDRYVMQEKMDGHRRLVRENGPIITGYKRNREPIGVPGAWSTGTNSLMDGEVIGDIFYAFDLIEFDGKNMRNSPFVKRWATLKTMVGDHDHIKVVPVSVTEMQKRANLVRLRNAGAEGVVFRVGSSPYTSGRSHDAYKYKFYETAHVKVAGHNSQRSVQMETHYGTSIGNVTIPPNYDVPPIGSIVLVRYLYYYQNGSLYQPVYKGLSENTHADITQTLKTKKKD